MIDGSKAAKAMLIRQKDALFHTRNISTFKNTDIELSQVCVFFTEGSNKYMKKKFKVF